MKETRFKDTEIGKVPVEWKVKTLAARYEQTLSATEQSVTSYENEVNGHLREMGFEF